MTQPIPVYSIAKPFLASTVLALGLPLDGKIGDLVPNLARVYAERTVGQLLNHTSGLDDYSALKEYGAAVAAAEPAWSREELLTRALALKHVNIGFQYSNIGYLLLRMAIEEHTGKSLFASMCESIPALAEAAAAGLAFEWETPTDVVPGYDPRWVYSGTFLAEPEAIAPLFSSMTAHRKTLAPLNAGVSPVPYPNTGFDNPGYAYGLMEDGGSPENEPLLVGHGGGGPGFSLMVLHSVRTGQSALEWSVESGFNQAEAIVSLSAKLVLEP